MQKTPPPVPCVVKREDKMENLLSFVKAHWLTPGGQSDAAEITLVARSAESPVARALLALGADIAARGLTVRAIFGQLEAEKTAAGWSFADPDIPFARQLRWAANPRLADAHEQLVLGPTASWIGDCLRRDPSRRDAYEQFAPTDAATGRNMRQSFERLWAASVPLSIRTPMKAPVASAGSVVADDALAALVAAEDAGGPLVSSQH